MSMEVIKKAREDQQPSNLSATQGVKGTPSLVALGIANGHLEALLQVEEMTREDHRPTGALGNEKDAEEATPNLSSLATSYQLTDELKENDAKDKKVQKEMVQGPHGQQLGETDNDSGNKKKVEFTQKSVFEAAGEMSKLQTENNNSLANQVKNELAIMEAQLQAMQAIEQFWQKFGPAWKAFQDDPTNYDKFTAVMHLLEEEYQNNPGMEAYLKAIENAGTDEHNREDSWSSESGWHHFWHGEPLSDPHYWRNFVNGINGTLQNDAEEAVGNPSLFENALVNGQEAFQAKISQLFQTVEVLMDIVKILEGSAGSSQTAMFDMEALLMDLEQLQINTNTQKSQQQQQISHQTAENMQHNLKKIKEALKKATEHHSGGLFGFIKHFFESIGKLFENIGKAVYYEATGQTDKAKKAFDQLTSGFKIFGEAFSKIFSGNFKEMKEGFEELVTTALITMILMPFLGPAALAVGPAMLGTKFGNDMQDMVSLITDAVQAYYQLIGAGIMAATGHKDEAAKLMESDKKLGEDMLANPALKTITDIAMVVIIFAMAATGNEVVAGIMLALFVASEEGWLQEGTQKLAEAIGGPNNAVAKVIADVIVIAAITLLTAGAGAAEAFFATSTDAAVAAGEEVASELGEVAAEEGSQGADQAASQGSDQASQATSRGAQIAKRAASMGAFGFGSTLGSSSLALDILQATGKKDSEALAIILELVQVIVAAVTASIGGFSTMSQSLGSTARAAESAGTNLTQLASRMQVAATSVSAVSGAAQGGETIIQGAANKDLAQYQANVTLDEATQNNADAMIKQTSEELKQLVKGYEELIATAFKTPAEVANAELQSLIQG